MTLNDLELFSKKWGHLVLFAIFGCDTHFKNKLLRNGWRLT